MRPRWWCGSGGKELARAVGADSHGARDAGVGEAGPAEALSGVAGGFGEEVNQGDQDDQREEEVPEDGGQSREGHWMGGGGGASPPL